MPQTESFTEMLIANLPRLRSHAMGMVRDRASADDLVQETAFLALRAERQFAAGTNFPAWTYRILRNCFLTSMRQAKRAPVRIDDVSEDVLVTRSRQEDLVFTHEVVRAMGKLSENQQQVINLVCTADLTYAQAAAKADTSVGTIKSRLWRARKRMESLVAESECVPQADGCSSLIALHQHA